MAVSQASNPWDTAAVAPLGGTILGIGWSEILIIGVVVLIVVGPDKLPQFARTAGRLYGQLRRTADEMRRALVLEADRQDAESRYKEMMERRRRAEEERRKHAEENPGTEAQEEHVPEPPDAAADPDEASTDGAAAGAITGSAAASGAMAMDAGEADDDLQSLLDDPNCPYGAGTSLDELVQSGRLMSGPQPSSTPDRDPHDLPFMTPAHPGSRAGGTRAGGAPGAGAADRPPPGVTEEEWAELPAHIKAMLIQRAAQGERP